MSRGPLHARFIPLPFFIALSLSGLSLLTLRFESRPSSSTGPVELEIQAPRKRKALQAERNRLVLQCWKIISATKLLIPLGK